MGSYAQCWLSDLYVGSTKNEINPDVMSLFRNTDKNVVREKMSLPLPQMNRWLAEVEGDDSNANDDIDYPFVYYAAPSTTIIDRLNLFGYTFETSCKVFEEGLKGQIAQYKRLYREYGKEELEDHYQNILFMLENFSVETWQAGLIEVLGSGLKPNYYGRFDQHHEDSLVSYVLSHDWYGFPGVDMNAALRIALEVFPEAQELIYDVTELVWSGYFDTEDDFVEYAINQASSEYHSKAKTIILTEGRTDSQFLSETLELLYPHLANYYSFLDFDTAKIGGGAGNLVNLVKAFTGAGIVNRIIALFDNDTAAESSLKSLKKLDVSPNIKVLRLPEIQLLTSYPTIGPSGKTMLDINGVAASIEMYLGQDVLTNEEGELTPIQWTGYDARAKKYQGEVLEKDKIHKRFREKLNLALRCGASYESQDWRGLQAVFELIFSAFHSDLQEEICGWTRELYDLT